MVPVIRNKIVARLCKKLIPKTMKTALVLITLIFAGLSTEAQLVACRPKICMLDYNYHNDSGPNADKSAIQAARPDILIDNTHGGYWAGGCLPSQYTPLGIKVFSYITGGYEGTEYGTTEDALASNLGRVDAIALDGASGVFLDEVTNYPNAAGKAYISAIYDECVLKGLKLILNPGTSTFDSWLMTHCDYLMSDESYDGIRLPSASEVPYKDRILVIAHDITSAATAATITAGAKTAGFGYSYACTLYTSIPAWLSSYLSAVTHAYAGTITGASNICAATTTTLVDTTTGGMWSSSNTAVASVSSSGTITGIAAGTANISYTVTNSCGTATTSKAITVNPLPAPGIISGASNVCVSAITSLTNTSFGGVWSSSNPSIATISGTGTITGIAAGIATISYTVTNSCGTATSIKMITVNPLPAAGSITGASAVCILSNITLSDLTVGGSWSSSNMSIADISSSGIVSGTAAGTVMISYTVSNICGTATATKPITVFPLPSPITGPSSVCVGLTETLSSATPGGTWLTSSVSIASITSSGILMGIAPGTAEISYTLATSCASTRIVTVSPLPAAITGMTGMCLGATVTLHDDTLGGTWSSSNPAIATVAPAGIITGSAEGTAAITYTTVAGCIAITTVTVDIPSVLSAIAGLPSVCEGASITLFNSVADGVWGSSNASAIISASGIVTGSAAGLDTIIYSVTNYCGTESVTKAITVNPIPTTPTISGSSVVCVGHTIDLLGIPASGLWSVASGNISVVAGAVTGISEGVDAAIYTVTNSCGSASTTYPIMVVPKSDCEAVTSVANDMADSPASIRIYPNPSNGQFTVEVPEAGKAQLRITDLSGREIENTNIIVNQDHKASYVANNILNGICLLTVTMQQHTYRAMLLLRISID